MEPEIIIKNSFEKIIKKLRKNKQSQKNKKYPLQKETLELEFEFFKLIDKIKFSNSFSNITKIEFTILRDFIKNKPFVVCQCDKNVGSAIMSHETYANLNNAHLSVCSNFVELLNDPLANVTIDIDNTIN